MNEQNIYDNEIFFDGYKKLRENQASSNNLVEKPELFSLCPDFKNKDVLDLGCGYGENCEKIAELGARNVVGIDISKKMLHIANKEKSRENISFFHMSMSDLSGLNQKFHIVLSSLAMHYIEDFPKLLKSVHGLLNDGGLLIFSQEHPFTTATKTDDFWAKNENGEILHYKLRDYSVLGERRATWFVDNVVKYHRSFSSIINALIDCNFAIEKVSEPVPDEKIMEQYPNYKRFYHKPDFLFIKARKI